MRDDDLIEYLRTRVSRQMKNDFDEICRELGKTPTEQLRELADAFVKREYSRLKDRISVHLWRPAGYDYGAWRATIRLRDPVEMTWGGAAIPFVFPALPKRLIKSDPEYQAVVYDPATHQPSLGGKFVNGEWRGHLYSNGCPEPESPTSIEDAREAITSTIEEVIHRFSAQSS